MCYRIFKTEFKLGNYGDILSTNLNDVFFNKNLDVKVNNWQFKMVFLGMEWYNISHLCDSNDIVDEYHFIMCCA